MRPLLLWLILAGCLAQARPLLVVSIDGLDQRYLRDADKLGLKIPNLRKLLREGATADGVIGVMPTVTWPSHTTLISGVIPHVHGILGNRRPKAEGGEYYWSTNLLKAPTLLDAVRKQGGKSAAITWPVTVDGLIDFNLPEAFSRRNGGGMDMATIEAKGTPGLVDAIAREYPSFPTEWMDDRARTQATMYFLRFPKPDLILVHLVDHDAAAHDNGPFSREAKAMIEYSDELLGEILKVMPAEYALAVVSDHGFERTDHVVEIEGDDLTVTPWLVLAHTEAAAAHMRKQAGEKKGIGRQLEAAELKRRAPQFPDSVAAWEPAPHYGFAAAGTTPEFERGNHGYWPTRADYRSVFLLYGRGIRPQRFPEMEMTSIAARLAEVAEITWPLR